MYIADKEKVHKIIIYRYLLAICERGGGNPYFSIQIKNNRSDLDE